MSICQHQTQCYPSKGIRISACNTWTLTAPIYTIVQHILRMQQVIMGRPILLEATSWLPYKYSRPNRVRGWLTRQLRTSASHLYRYYASTVPLCLGPISQNPTIDTNPHNFHFHRWTPSPDSTLHTTCQRTCCTNVLMPLFIHTTQPKTILFVDNHSVADTVREFIRG